MRKILFFFSVMLMFSSMTCNDTHRIYFGDTIEFFNVSNDTIIVAGLKYYPDTLLVEDDFNSLQIIEIAPHRQGKINVEREMEYLSQLYYSYTDKEECERRLKQRIYSTLFIINKSTLNSLGWQKVCEKEAFIQRYDLSCWNLIHPMDMAVSTTYLEYPLDKEDKGMVRNVYTPPSR